MPTPQPPDDLIDACRRGDREAFGELFDLCRDRVHAVALGICGDRAVAADVTQDVFIKVLTRLSQFDGRSAFTTWLYRLAVNTALDTRRASRRLVALPDGVADGRRVDEEFARREERRRVAGAVQALPDHLRVPIVLRHHEGLAYADIARILDVPPGTVASRLARAHAAIARTLALEPPDHARAARCR